MIYRFEIVFRRLRRWLSRSEWASKLLRLKRQEAGAVTAGLVIIQIDGLSRAQLLHAIEKKRLPFLERLVKRERYRLYTHYSGMPASTPAVQGELFYGVKTAVPAFSFVERDSGKIIRMFDNMPAAQYERELAKQGEPLLKGGSAYSDIFTGGAAESHFCPSSLGWGEVLKSANPFALIFLFITNFYSVLRICGLLVVEFFLAITDFARGVIVGRDLYKELKFVPSRVAICILLRELITIGAKIDVTRGLPVVHLNFLGYDEQAHRRGPTSRFAHWTLKGIDDAIARIWRAAKRSAIREYDIWIYSDHGQIDTIPYEKQHKISIERAVTRVFEQFENERIDVKAVSPGEIQLQRVRLLGGSKFQRLFPIHRDVPSEVKIHELGVAAMGPVAMIYYSRSLGHVERDRIAKSLVFSAEIPLVLVAGASGRAIAWTAEGEFQLPEQRQMILGEDHPFLDELTEDLIVLCHHHNAGDFVICGWAAGRKAISYSIENGSHAGIHPGEVEAFALLPGDAILPDTMRDYLRPLDLRRAALHLLDREQAGGPLMKSRRKRHEGRLLRMMTYNVHSCIGMDGRLSPQRIARVIADYSPDIIALQELDVGKARTGGVDQAGTIAQDLEMEYHFHPTVHLEEERYGDAVITHLPMRLVKAGMLPGLDHKPQLEPRGAIWVVIEVEGKEVQFINTHLGLLPSERRKQAAALLGSDWLQHPECRGPVILAGDFNALPGSTVCRHFARRLSDAQIALVNHRPRRTLFGRYPVARIDHIFVEPTIEIDYIEVPQTTLARTASDHLPLIVDVRFP